VFAPDRLVTAARVPVGIFGLLGGSEDQTTRWQESWKKENRQGLSLSDPVEAARRSVTGLRSRGARLVIGLFHFPGSAAEARRIVREVGGIDFVVLGHGDKPPGTSNPTPARVPSSAPLEEGATRLLETHPRGTYLGRLDLHLVGQGPLSFADARRAMAPLTSSWLTNRLVTVLPSIARRDDVAALVNGHIAESRRRLDKHLPTGVAPAPGQLAGVGDTPTENWDYGSDSACNLCHPMVVDQQKKTAHVASLDTLAARGRQRDPYCLGCHTVAWLRKGGTRNLETATTYFGDVGCESCHGPSAQHIRTEKKTDTRRAVPEAVCLECHRPDQSPEPFDYSAALPLVLGPHHQAKK
jgi:hypothetical protein